MGRFTEVIAGIPGYFREHEEEAFPWSNTGRSVWYALFVVESGKIERYGFTSSKSNKASLLTVLNSLSSADEATLLGVWTGQYNTHLFVLDRAIAVEKLSASKSQ